MAKEYKSGAVQKNKKGYYLTTENQGAENIDINLVDFLNEKMKGVTITSNSTFTGGAWNWITSTLFNDIITAKNANHYITLRGWGTKTVTTGNYKDTIDITNSGNNKINLGNGENQIYIRPGAAKNTISTGVDKDSYTIQGGNNTIVDYGGDNVFSFVYGSKNKITIKGEGTNTFTLSGGQNDITSTKGANIFTYNGDATDKIKTGSFVDKFDVLLMGSSSTLNIDSGAGDDELTIKSYSSKDTPSRITANLGTGNDEVDIVRASSSYGVITDIKTGKGEDNVEIYAGLINKIDTGDDIDTVTICDGRQNYISTGNGNDCIYIKSGWTSGDETHYINDAESTVKTGKGSDYISINGGYNTIYGEAGNDTIAINGGYNTIYGGNDEINIWSGENTIYASGDIIGLIDGINTIYTKKGNNTITVGGGTTGLSNIINLSKGNNTVNLAEETAQATVNITAGKNYININNIDQLLVKSTAKTAQTVDVNGCSNSTIVFDVKKGSCNILDDSSSNEIYGGDNAETFNIQGGSSNNINGKAGNDIYNLYTGARATISDTQGKNKINIKKGYSGLAMIMNCSDDNKYTFDKNYKLTNTKNVNNDIIVTDKNSLTLFCNYADSDGTISTYKTLTMNIKEEIKGTDRSFDNSSIFINSNGGIYNIGGKNYKLDLTSLKQDLAGWFDNHSAYANKSTDYVLSNGSEADINSLMAVYTKDTANCFIKA